VDLADLPAPSAEVAAAFNRNICLSHGFLPLRRVGEAVEVVLGDAQPEAVAELVSRRLGCSTRFAGPVRGWRRRCSSTTTLPTTRPTG
jgi:general secretion pathway protein E